MRKIILLSILNFLFGFGNTQAQVVVDTSDLVDECRHAWPDPLYYHCAGYLTGVLETLQVGLKINEANDKKLSVVQEKDGLGALSLVKTIVPDQLAKEFVKYVESHPEELHKQPLNVVAEALVSIDEKPPQEFVPPVYWEICGRQKSN
jgi:hypothetical protein